MAARRAWILALALASSSALARAHPNYVGCDRTGSSSGDDVMTKSSIMGVTPTDTTLMTASSTTYAPGDSVTVTLSGLSSGAFVHTSAGTPATISGFTAKTCTGTSLQYKSSSVSSTETLTWTAPSDLTGVATVEISAGTASGYGQIKRHTLTLTRAAAAACAANERVSAGACASCAAGTTRAAGDDPYAGDTTCAATLCAANERVSGNACVACAAGTTNAAGDDASGSDTTCDATLCATNEYVSGNACASCATGVTNAAGDDASGVDTTCDGSLCASDQRVSGNACVSCGAGTTNAAGDDASGADTTCAATTVLIVEDEAADEDDAEDDDEDDAEDEDEDEDEDTDGSVLEISSDGASSASTRVVPAAAAALAGAVGFCLYQ